MTGSLRLVPTQNLNHSGLNQIIKQWSSLCRYSVQVDYRGLFCPVCFQVWNKLMYIFPPVCANLWKWTVAHELPRHPAFGETVAGNIRTIRMEEGEAGKIILK